jgi:hypothetical protein
VTRQAEGLYDNPYYHDNVYGHALDLLRRTFGGTAGGHIHLDIGCGYGRLAEPLTAELDLTYVGVDGDEGGLESLRTRSFEAHHLWLGEEEATFAALEQIVGGRPVASISMLDTLEHLADGDATLRAISRLAQQHAALVVISVPNVTHADIGFRLAFGRWDYTEDGLLDHTHTRLFGSEVLDRTLRHAGLYPIASNDVLITRSDQHFPADHPALAPGTLLHCMLMQLRTQASGTANVNQFLRLCATGRPVRGDAFLRAGDDASPRPFLSVVVRTRGNRPHTLVEALTALAGQTDTDFEVLVIGHRLSLDNQKAVERTIEDSPGWLRHKCRLIRVDDGNRTRPLNVGFAAAGGRYIAILDDDDMPFGHWVETFRTLDAEHPGRLLRAATVRQDVVNITIDGLPGLRATGPLEHIYAQRFDFLQHLHNNQTPPVSLAFPRGAFHDLGICFDETLTTTEDWDYLLRVAAVVGVASSPEITSIYRWWPTNESSRTLHPQEEWVRNHAAILGKLDAMPLLLPPGTVRRVNMLLDEAERAAAPQVEVEATAARAPAGSDADPERFARLREVLEIFNSTSWRLSAPVRLLGRIFGKPAANSDVIWQIDSTQLADLAAALRRSTSWRITAPVRRLRRR